MSLQLAISAQENKNSFTVYDCTGKFNFDNKGGYGGPNIKTSDVTDAWLEILTPGQSQPVIKNVYPSLPDTTETGYEIFPSVLNNGNEVESGKYKIKYVIQYTDENGNIKTYSTSLVKVFINSVTCCIDKHIKLLDKDAHEDQKQQLIIELANLLDAVNYQIECGLYDLADKTIDYLKSQCKCCDC